MDAPSKGPARSEPRSAETRLCLIEDRYMPVIVPATSWDFELIPRLRALILAKGFPSYSAAAKQIGWPQSRLSRVLSGHQPLTRDALDHVLGALGAKDADLIALDPVGEDDRPSPSGRRPGWAMPAPTPENDTVGRRIMRRREALGLNRTQFGEKCGLTATRVLHIEERQRKVHQPTLQRIAAVLGCAASDLLPSLPAQ